MPDFNSNSNQRSIVVHKEVTNNENIENYYAKINLNALKMAMSSLTPKAFELWIYLSKNKDKYFMWLSKVDFLNWSNVKSTSYYKAFDELKELGYLVERENNMYDFYEVPKEEQIGITIHKEA